MYPNIKIKKILCASIAVLLAACASTAPAPTLQSQLQTQLAEINALNHKLSAASNLNERHHLLEQRQRAFQLGAQLINQAQAEKLAAHNACRLQQKHLPTDAYTCAMEESAEDTQLRMLGVLMQSAWEEGRQQPSPLNSGRPL